MGEDLIKSPARFESLVDINNELVDVPDNYDADIEDEEAFCPEENYLGRKSKEPEYMYLRDQIRWNEKEYLTDGNVSSDSAISPYVDSTSCLETEPDEPTITM